MFAPYMGDHRLLNTQHGLHLSLEICNPPLLNLCDGQHFCFETACHPLYSGHWLRLPTQQMTLNLLQPAWPKPPRFSMCS